MTGQRTLLSTTVETNEKSCSCRPASLQALNTRCSAFCLAACIRELAHLTSACNAYQSNIVMDDSYAHAARTSRDKHTAALDLYNLFYF